MNGLDDMGKNNASAFDCDGHKPTHRHEPATAVARPVVAYGEPWYVVGSLSPATGDTASRVVGRIVRSLPACDDDAGPALQFVLTDVDYVILERIVACVNACAGMDEPAMTIIGALQAAVRLNGCCRKSGRMAAGSVKGPGPEREASC